MTVVALKVRGERRSSAQDAGLDQGCASICTTSFLGAVSASARLHFAIHKTMQTLLQLLIIISAHHIFLLQ